MHVLVVDDDPALRDAVRRALRLEGYEVAIADGGVEALDAVRRKAFDAIVLDVMMPDLDGLAVCRHLRREADRTPVLMLTARDAVGDRVSGLDAGADDYLVKPFALEELLARLRALLRRTTTDQTEIVVDDLVIDPAARSARRGDRLIELTRTEFALLELLARNARVVVPRDVIFDRVWGYPLEFGSNSLDVYIGYVRRKTESGGEARLIHTVRGVGFVLRPAASG
jgi:two-component system, OmpR family, response regulator MprA